MPKVSGAKKTTVRKKTSFSKRFDIAKAIEEVIKLTPLKEGCYYLDGYSDAVLAERFEVSKSVVANIRHELFGDLKTFSKEDRIEKLEGQWAASQKEIERINTALNLMAVDGKLPRWKEYLEKAEHVCNN